MKLETRKIPLVKFTVLIAFLLVATMLTMIVITILSIVLVPALGAFTTP